MVYAIRLRGNTFGRKLVGEYARACLDLDYRDFRSGRFAIQLRLIDPSCLKGSITQQETPHPKLHPHAYATSPNLRATASEAPFSHDVL